MTLCAALSGCAEKENTLQPALTFRTALLESGGCTFSCDVTADYGSEVYGFSLDCTWLDGKATLTVTKPETISGITAEVADDGAAILFDGVRLEYGRLANGHVAPLSVPWLFGSAWESDYISSAGEEDGCCRMTVLKGYNDAELTVDTWLEDGIPVCGEVTYAGTRVLAVTFRDFSFAGRSVTFSGAET